MTLRVLAQARAITLAPWTQTKDIPEDWGQLLDSLVSKVKVPLYFDGQKFCYTFFVVHDSTTVVWTGPKILVGKSSGMACLNDDFIRQALDQSYFDKTGAASPADFIAAVDKMILRIPRFHTRPAGLAVVSSAVTTLDTTLELV